jgi:coproporphyrinogen dehydrogenase HemZ
MIKVFTEGHDYYYEVADILANYCRRDEIEFIKEKVPAKGRGLFVHSELAADRDGVIVKCTITGERNPVTIEDRFGPAVGSALEVRKQYKRYVKHNLLKAAERFFQKELPWGILTGIRPVKMIHKLMDKGLGQEEILKHLVEFYRLDPEKARLGMGIALTERKFIFPNEPGRISIYISIPFCPTRCSYCSFPSNQLSRWGHLTEKYMDCLAGEIKAAGSALKSKGITCDTVYIGGGTPTSLNLSQLDRFFGEVRNAFISPDTRELTVEAGRPDTLDREKLGLIKRFGATRISINPQTMNASTLEVIGRKHSPEDIIRAFELARQAGHNNINMDIIMGLPGENVDMVMHTLGYIGALKPEGVTVHTLAVKRASRLHEEAFDAAMVEESEVEAMMKCAREYLQRMGMKPYYLYRQKYMVGNLENIGFCFPGYEGIYNMQIMEERQTVLGLGAGAVSKLVILSEDRLERIQNPKSLQHYMERAEALAREKEELVARHCHANCL